MTASDLLAWVAWILLLASGWELLLGASARHAATTVCFAAAAAWFAHWQRTTR